MGRRKIFDIHVCESSGFISWFPFRLSPLTVKRPLPQHLGHWQPGHCPGYAVSCYHILWCPSIILPYIVVFPLFGHLCPVCVLFLSVNVNSIPTYCGIPLASYHILWCSLASIMLSYW